MKKNSTNPYKKNIYSHKGTYHHIFQRVTAIFNLIFLILAFYYFYPAVNNDPDVLSSIMNTKMGKMIAGLALFFAFLHAKMGLEMIITDYVRNDLQKKLLFINMALFLYICVTSYIIVVN